MLSTLNPAIVHRIERAVNSFFKPWFGSPPPVQDFLDAMTPKLGQFKVVRCYSDDRLYFVRSASGDPLRRYTTLFRLGRVFGRRHYLKSLLIFVCFRRLVRAWPPWKELSSKIERIVDYQESFEDGCCSGNLLIMEFRGARTSPRFLECSVKMSEKAFPQIRIRETTYEFRFSTTGLH
jgi:hypothetical protein